MALYMLNLSCGVFGTHVKSNAQKIIGQLKADGLEIIKYHKDWSGGSSKRILQVKGKKLVWTISGKPHITGSKRLKGRENLVDLTIRQESKKIILSIERHTILKFGTYGTSIDDVETALISCGVFKRKSTLSTAQKIIIDQLKANGLKIRKFHKNSHDYAERILRVEEKKLVWTTKKIGRSNKSQKLAGLTIKIDNEYEYEMGQTGNRIKVIPKVKGQKKTTYDGTCISYNSTPYILEFEILEGKIGDVEVTVGDVKVALEDLIKEARR